MGDQLVSVDTPKTEGADKAPFSKIFWSCLPSYIAMGMTEEQFFHGDPMLCKAYREAWEIKTKYERDLSNWRAWLMGGYVYQVMGDMASAYNSLKPKRPTDYLKKPFPIEENATPKETDDNPLFDYMMQFMKMHNERNT